MHVFPGTWVFVLDKSKIDGKQRGEIKKWMAKNAGEELFEEEKGKKTEKTEKKEQRKKNNTKQGLAHNF